VPWFLDAGTRGHHAAREGIRVTLVLGHCSRRALSRGILALDRMIACFDESGSHQGAPVFGLACFVARERQWDNFRNRWRRLLDQQAVPEIHMADLEARRGHFEGWSDERYELVRTTIGIILTGVRLWGFYNAFLMKDYDAVIQRPKRGRRFYWAATPYVISLQAILEMMAEKMASGLRRAETITCVCDRNKQVAGEARQRFESLRQTRTDWGRVYSGLSFASMRDDLALQAADVLVYENCRWMQTWVRHQENGTSPSETEKRPLMKRLVKTGRMKGLFFDRDQIRALWVAAQRSEQRTVEDDAARTLNEPED
jgi:hypothetical protein